MKEQRCAYGTVASPSTTALDFRLLASATSSSRVLRFRITSLSCKINSKFFFPAVSSLSTIRPHSTLNAPGAALAIVGKQAAKFS
jgi:hypothetical protein